MANKTPTAKVIDAAAASTAVVDADGRSITFKKLDALDRMELAGIVGGDNAVNQAYMLYAVIAASITMIDGTPYAPPANLVALKARVRLMGDAGFDAIVGSFKDGADDAAKVMSEAKN